MAATSSSTSGAVKTQANWRKKRKPSTDTIASTTIITAAAAAGEVSLIYPYNAYSHNANSPNHSRRKWLSEFVVRKD